MQVTTSFSDVVDEKKFFFTRADNENEPAEHTLQQKDESRQDAKEWVAHEEISSLKNSGREFMKINRNTMS